MKATLTKVKWNKGTTESGQVYDYTRVYLLVPIYESSVNEFGVDMMECQFGNADDYARLLPLKGRLPMEVNVEITQAMKGGKMVNVIQTLDVPTERPAPKLQQN